MPYGLGGEREKKKRATQLKPKRHERDTARALGGRRQAASGSRPGAKGDVRDVEAQGLEFLTECKTTDGAKSLRLEARWLVKIFNEARELGQFPMLAVRFDAEVLDAIAREMWIEHHRPFKPPEGDWVMIPRSVFVRLQRDDEE